MLDWNGNGSFDAFDSATDYMLSEDQSSKSAGLLSNAEQQKDEAYEFQQELKPWQYLLTIFSSLIFLYGFVILVLLPEFVLEALQDIFGDYLLVLIVGSMLVIGMYLYVKVTSGKKTK